MTVCSYLSNICINSLFINNDPIIPVHLWNIFTAAMPVSGNYNQNENFSTFLSEYLYTVSPVKIINSILITH